jgi:predicted nucleotide-binding protein
VVISVPVAGENVSEPSDLAGVYTLEWSFKPILDSAFMTALNGAFLKATVINTATGL